MHFYKEIENYFLVTRGRLFGGSSYNLLSPKEISLIKKWEEAGIPLRVIRSGIQEALIRFLENNPNKSEAPPNLIYCNPTVKKHWRLLKEASVGRSVDRANLPVVPTPDVVPWVRDLTALLRKASLRTGEKEEFTRIMNSVLLDIEDLLQKRQNSEISDIELQERTERVGNALPPKLGGILSFSEVKTLLVSVHKKIGAYMEKMTRSDYRETRDELFKEALFDHFRIPDFKMDNFT